MYIIKKYFILSALLLATHFALGQEQTDKSITEVNELDEVEVIHYSKINAVDLGIVSKNQKQYTPAEKNLINVSAGEINGTINRINGNVRRAKQLIEYEKRGFLIDDLKAQFPDTFFIEKLKIPEEYIGGFLLYCTDDEEFCNRLKGANPVQTSFFLTEKATSFLPLIQKS